MNDTRDKPFYLAIIILNYKTPDLTIQCVDSCLPQLPPNSKIVIVDNDSQDGSVLQLRQWLQTLGSNSEKVQLIEAGSNSGFSGGNNVGIKAIHADFYLLLNSDTYLRDNALEHLLSHAEANPQVGLVSPRLEWPNAVPQISCFKFRTPISEFINASANSLITRLFFNWNVPISVTNTCTTPEWTSFACVLLKKELISQTGLMDENYFLYFEDIDFCHRINESSFNISNNPQARVVHLRGGSSEVKANTKRKKALPAYVYESRARYFRKNYGISGLLLANIALTLGFAINSALRLIGKREVSLCENEVRDSWSYSYRSVFKQH